MGTLGDGYCGRWGLWAMGTVGYGTVGDGECGRWTLGNGTVGGRWTVGDGYCRRLNFGRGGLWAIVLWVMGRWSMDCGRWDCALTYTFTDARTHTHIQRHINRHPISKVCETSFAHSICSPVAYVSLGCLKLMGSNMFVDANKKTFKLVTR